MAFIGGDKMKKVAVKDLTHSQISWCVELAERMRNGCAVHEVITPRGVNLCLLGDIPNYCADWSKAGPIIERERIGIYHTDDGFTASTIAVGKINYVEGAHLLPAAMRCYVLAVFGDVVELPE